MSGLDVVIVGSANQDLVLSVETIPRPGETVLAGNRATHAGGKGLNQAVAAARAGATTAFLGTVGDDDAGRMLRQLLVDTGINIDRLRPSDEATGLAIITVDEQGENSIVVASGANGTLLGLDAEDLEVVRSAKVLVLQLEIPLETVCVAAAAARAAGVQVILNAAPAHTLPDDLLAVVDLLIVNEHEARTLAPDAPEASDSASFDTLVAHLLERVPGVVVTLGANGAVATRRDEEPSHHPAPHARVVDTTGAGDTFTGALAAALARGDSLQDAVWFGSVAGSLAGGVAGAVPSIPKLDAIRERQRVTSPRDGWPDPTVARPIDLPTPVPLDEGADLSVLDEAKIIGAPADRGDWLAWRERLEAWRSSARERFGYDGSRYDEPANAWAARAWNVAIVWLWDEALYDWDVGRFDVDRLIATYEPWGGLDGAVLWHAYPVIGIDDRNQFDFYREVPGLTELVHDLQARGIRVFLDYNPWDTGTRRPPRSDAEEVAALVRETGADGVFLDTLKEGDATLRDALLALSPAPALEGESRVPTARIGDHSLSWAQWMADTKAPGVLRARWYEQRHMMHHTRRWNHDHSDELQSAWINGVGVLIWDVVFGSYVGWSPRDLSIMRAMRRVHRSLGDHLVRGDWAPLPDALAVDATEAGVFGASYELNGTTLWTLINRADQDYSGSVLSVSGEGDWFDLVAGTNVTGLDVVSLEIPARGIGCVLHVAPGAEVPYGLADLLTAAAADPLVPGTAVELPWGVAAAMAPVAGELAPAAVLVPGGEHRIGYRYRVRETGLRSSPAYRSGTWKPLPPHLHGEAVGMFGHTSGGVAVDPAEVTNADYAVFLAETGYRPKIDNRFLAHWVDGHPAPRTEDEPVTYVDLDDAQAYAAWRGARLPTEPEWQLAATVHRDLVVDPSPYRNYLGTDPADRVPNPAFRRLGPLVWNWTAPVCSDGRTRWVLVKGGSWYAAEGSDWYFDGGPRDPDWVARLLVAGGGLARSAAIGFRCVVDLVADESIPADDDGRWTEFGSG